MPSHLYITRTVPPRLHQIILSHALEVSVACLSIAAGMIVGVHADDLAVFATTTPLRFLPVHLLYGLAIFLVFGGAATLTGLTVRRNNIRVELNIEQTGWVVLAVGWGTYAWASIYYANGATLSYIVAGFITIGATLRALALFALEKQIDAAVREGVDTGSVPPEEAHDE